MNAPSNLRALVNAARVSAVCAALAGASCTSDDLITGGKEPRIRLDGGVSSGRDAAQTDPPDAGAGDRGTRADAGVPDATEPRDGGRIEPDAAVEPPDAGPPCECAPLPATCTSSIAGVPSFSPGLAMQEQLAAVIACADSTIHAAFYEATWGCATDLLLERLGRDPDLVVQLVVDDDQCPRVNGALSCDLSRLEGHPRVAIADDMRSRYMHHKFLVADGEQVWTSSANMTFSSFCSEHNNALVVDAPEIVGAYEAEFQRMFTGGDFGPTMRTPVSGGGYTLYVSPETPSSSAPAWFRELVRSIETSSTSVDFMIFAITRFEVGNALLEAHARGVAVRGLVAPEYRSEPVVEALIAAQIPVRIAPVHHKVLITDGLRVATGSPNWSQNAWENNEASLWIESATVAAAYTRELELLFAGALPP